MQDRASVWDVLPSRLTGARFRTSAWDVPSHAIHPIQFFDIEQNHCGAPQVAKPGTARSCYQRTRVGVTSSLDCNTCFEGPTLIFNIGKLFLK